jgi:hypothetical protein
MNITAEQFFKKQRALVFEKTSQATLQLLLGFLTANYTSDFTAENKLFIYFSLCFQR